MSVLKNQQLAEEYSMQIILCSKYYFCPNCCLKLSGNLVFKIVSY